MNTAWVFMCNQLQTPQRPVAQSHVGSPRTPARTGPHARSQACAAGTLRSAPPGQQRASSRSSESAARSGFPGLSIAALHTR
jgi:hypothetical protein